MLTTLAIINMAVAAFLITDSDIETANLASSHTESTEIVAVIDTQTTSAE